jgi:basic membrane protein A
VALRRALGLVAALAITGAACGGGGTAPAGGGSPTQTAGGEPGQEKVKFAILLPCQINDLSWCQAAYEGAKQLEDEGLIELSYTDNAPQDAAGATRLITGYANDGNQLIVGHSFNYGDPIRKLAPDFPEVNFAWQGGLGEEGTDQNVADYDMPMYEAAYLAGILGAGVTETGVFGGSAGFDIPVCRAVLEAFELGAKEVRQDARVLETFIGDWQDVAKAKEAALAQADQGADVFVACGDGPSQGMIQAVKERGLTAFGYVGDESSLAPENVLASMVWKLSETWRQMVKDVRNGTFQPGKFYKVGMAQGGFEVKLNPQYGREIPEEVMSLYEQRLEEITSGSFEVPFIPTVEG